MAILKSFLLISITFHCSSNGQHEEQFRKDYHFIDSLQNFYKIHTIPRTWKDAKQLCEWERATFFYPENQTESEIVLDYVKEVQGYNDFWIGISSLIAQGVFVTTDGIPMMDVYNNWNKHEPDNRNDNENCVMLEKSNGMYDDNCVNKKPYLCKKSLMSLQWNTVCNIPYMGYFYNETFGKCYKFHFTPKTWTEAYTICSSELSYLAIVDSQAEADFIFHRIISTDVPAGNLLGSYHGAAHLGFHNKFEDGWRTIKGTRLEESQFHVWGDGQPNGGDDEKCGTMLNGRLNDKDCDFRSIFVCEHDVDL